MLHTPERLPNETQADYRNRQAASKRAVEAITKPPRQAPAVSHLDVSRFWFGQHINPRRNKQRRALRLRKFAASHWLSHWTPTPTGKPRTHKQHAHQVRDEHGAFTLVGRSNDEPSSILVNGLFRRKWLAGVSAQRGY